MSLFENMTIFVRVVEAASFSGAAQRLGLAKSAKLRAFVDFLSERFGGTPYWDAALPEVGRAQID
jgi:hypothetical protein